MKANIRYCLIFFLLYIPVDKGGAMIGIEERLGRSITNDLEFFNKDSVKINLDTIINKPTILAFTYYTCSGLCDDLLHGLAELVEKSALRIGDDYQILTVSIRSTEQPYLARKWMEAFTNFSNKNIIEGNWLLLTGSRENIAKLTKSTGYHFFEENGKIIHPVLIIILDKSANVSRYMYGNRFLPLDFEMTIKNIGNDIYSTTIIKRLKYCYNHEAPARTRLNKFAVISGILVIVCAFSLFLFLVYRR